MYDLPGLEGHEQALVAALKAGRGRAGGPAALEWTHGLPPLPAWGTGPPAQHYDVYHYGDQN
eukprot:4869323-Lingulodinium_polyedra.AAC.1